MTRASAHSKRDGQPGTGGAQPRLTTGLARVEPISAVSPSGHAAGRTPAGHLRLLARPHWHGPHWHAVEHARSALSHLDRHATATAHRGRTARASERGHHERHRILAAALGSERGDTLIEILMSAFVLALIVSGTYFGLISANRTTAAAQARSQADSIAQADEEQLRTEPIEHLFEKHLTFARTREVTSTGATYTTGSGYTGPVFTVHTTGEERTAEGDTTCSAGEAPSTGLYALTRTEVTWRVSEHNEKVVETGIINQPSSISLIVRVVNRRHEPLENIDITAEGPSPSKSIYTAVTSATGCALFTMSEGGKYTVNVYQPEYKDVNPDWYSQTDADAYLGNGIVAVTDNAPVKKEFELERPGAIQASFATRFSEAEAPRAVKAIGAVAFQSETHPSYAAVRRKAVTEASKCVTSALNEQTESVTSPTCVFPFTTPYWVFAGTCGKNQPKLYGHEGEPYEDKVYVEPGVTAKAGNGTALILPAVVLRVYSGTSEPSESKHKASPTVYITETETGSEGCNSTKEAAATRSSWTVGEGALTNPAEPFGTYTICTQWTESGRTYSARAEGVKLSETAKGNVVDLFQTKANVAAKAGWETTYESKYSTGGC